MYLGEKEKCRTAQELFLAAWWGCRTRRAQAAGPGQSTALFPGGWHIRQDPAPLQCCLSALHRIALPFCFLYKLFPCLLVCSESAAQQRAMDLTLC